MARLQYLVVRKSCWTSGGIFNVRHKAGGKDFTGESLGGS